MNLSGEFQNVLLDDILDKVLSFEEMPNMNEISHGLTFVNDKYCEISGYTKEELIGKNHNIIRHPSMTKEFFKIFWKTILKKEILLILTSFISLKEIIVF